MKGLSYIDLQEQILHGHTAEYTVQDEHGVQSALLKSGKGEFSLWHKTVQLSAVIIDHLKLKSPAPVIIETTEDLPSTVTLNFTLQGSSESTFDDLQDQIHNAPQRHNMLYMANPSGRHTLKPTREIEKIHIGFQPDYFQALTSAEDPAFEKFRDNMENKHSMLFAPDHGLINLKMHQALTDMCSCVMKGSIKRLYLEAKVLELLSLQAAYFYNLNTTRESRAEKELFNRIRLYLTQYYLEDITLNSVCRYFGINEFKLKKGFQQYFNTSVIRFLTGLLMQQARQLLELGEHTIPEVSELLNYSHPNHFSTAFKKFFGLNPSEVRRVKKIF